MIGILAKMLTGNSTPPSQSILVIFSGESNAGGYVDNATYATETDTLPKPNIQILNNTSLQFEDLEIGVNNLIGHDGLPDNVTHGWELQLANRVDAEPIQFSAPLYLCKTGQGGSKISGWDTGGGWYTTFLTRANACLSELSNPLVFMFYSQGINDSIYGTSLATWKAATKAHFTKIRTDLGVPIPIIIPELMPAYSAYNIAFHEIAAEMDDVHIVLSTGATLHGDGNHWSYLGMKVVANYMIDKMLELT